MWMIFNIIVVVLTVIIIVCIAIVCGAIEAMMKYFNEDKKDG